MPDNFNQNGSGAQDALHEDHKKDGSTAGSKDRNADSHKNDEKNKSHGEGSDKSKNKPNKTDADDSLSDGNSNGDRIGKDGSSNGNSNGNKADAKSLSKGKGGAENPDNGGASSALEDDGQDEKPMGKKSKDGNNHTARKAAAAGNAATSAVAKASLLAKILAFMKMAMGLIQQGAAMVAGAIPAFIAGIINAVVAGAYAVGGFVASVGGALLTGMSAFAAGIAGALGIGSTAAAATAVAAVGTVLIASISIVGGAVLSLSNNKFDGNIPDCSASVEAVQTKASETNADAAMLDNAKKIYSVMKTFGLSDEQIAGMLGNWQIESSIDPTTIEGIYDETQNIQGPKHQDAMKDWDAYVRGPLSRKYAHSGHDYTQNSGYTASDGKKYPGIGLIQWTGGGAMTFLNFSKSVNKDWWTVDYQLAYMFAKGAPTGQYGNKFWDTYKSQSGGASECARWFAQYFEGNTSLAGAERASAAEKWLAQEKSWSADSKYGNSVISMAKQLGASAGDNAVASKLKSCVRSMKYDNSTLANAAVSYAYETKDEGRGNNGTPLYQRVHDVIWGAGDIYQSCDRGVATAVRWSGTDEEFPAGNTNAQLAYMTSSDKWTKVGGASSVKMSDLMPGDVFCIKGHVFMYVGHEAVAAKYPNTASNIDSVSASHNQRSPGCGNDANDIIVRNHGQDWNGRGEYQIFRCTKPDHGTRYKDAGAGVN
jgi:hypothetical protein